MAPALKKLENRKPRKGALSIIAGVTTLHLALLSFMFGPREFAYAMAAYFSAVVLWGLLFLLEGQKRIAAWIAGALALALIQQVAYRTMACESFGFWWPLAQFVSLHVLFGMAARAILNSGRGFISGRW